MVIKNVAYFTWVTGDRIIVIRVFKKSNRFCVLQFTGKYIVYSLQCNFILVKLTLKNLE